MNRRRSKLPCGWSQRRITLALTWLAIAALLAGAIRFWLTP